MKNVRDNKKLSPEILEALAKQGIDPSEIEDGDAEVAGYSIPEPPSKDDIPTKEASVSEPSSGDSVEVKSGMAESGEEAAWYRVEFSEAFRSATQPVVLATATRRSGEFNSGAYKPPEHGVDTPSEVSIDSLSLPGVEISDVEVLTPSVSSRGIETDVKTSVNQKGIAVPELGERTLSDVSFDDVTVPQVEVGEVDFDAPSLNHFSANEEFSFESEFKQASRDVGRLYYEVGKDAFNAYLPSIYDYDLADYMIDAWDTMMKEAYGYGSSEKYGEGVIEGAYGELGAAMDSVIKDAFDTKKIEQEDLASEVEQSIITHNNNIIDSLNAFFANLDQTLKTFNEDVDSAFTGLHDNTEITMQNMNTNIEDELITMNNEILDELTAVTDETTNELQSLATAVEDLGIDTETSVEDLSFEIEDMSSEINEVLDNMSSDINGGLKTLSDNIESTVNSNNKDIEENVNSSVSEIESSINSKVNEINKALNNQNGRINDAYAQLAGLSESALNNSQSLLYSSLGMPEGELMTPVQVRNVTNKGFEFLGYKGGMKIHWVAMGQTSGGSSIDESGKIVDEVIEELENRGAIDGSN